MTLAHWDEVKPERREVGEMRATFRRIAAAAGATVVGVARIDVDPGGRSGPVHVHGSEEEIFFVLSGSGGGFLFGGALRGGGLIDGAGHEGGAGDTIVYLASGPRLTVIGGDYG